MGLILALIDSGIPATVGITGVEAQVELGSIVGIAQVDATVALTGNEITLETGSPVAFISAATENAALYGSARLKLSVPDRADATVTLPSQTVLVFESGLRASGEHFIDATVGLNGFQIVAKTGKIGVRNDTTTALRGNTVRIANGAVKSKGIHNPSDEEIIAIIMEAMVA